MYLAPAGLNFASAPIINRYRGITSSILYRYCWARIQCTVIEELVGRATRKIGINEDAAAKSEDAITDRTNRG